MLLPKNFIGNKIVFTLLTLFTTLGSVLFSGLYVTASKVMSGTGIRIFYKDMISGREEVWGELWEEFFKQPFTGIGSSFVSRFDYIKGIEVHSALLDILIVHGLIVFAGVLFFLLLRLFGLRKFIIEDSVSYVAFSAMISMLTAAFFENYIIVAPFSMMFFVLFIIINSRKLLH